MAAAASQMRMTRRLTRPPGAKMAQLAKATSTSAKSRGARPVINEVRNMVSRRTGSAFIMPQARLLYRKPNMAIAAKTPRKPEIMTVCPALSSTQRKRFSS